VNGPEPRIVGFKTTCEHRSDDIAGVSGSHSCKVDNYAQILSFASYFGKSRSIFTCRTTPQQKASG
jgi:hypothetical protein